MKIDPTGEGLIPELMLRPVAISCSLQITGNKSNWLKQSWPPESKDCLQPLAPSNQGPFAFYRLALSILPIYPLITHLRYGVYMSE